MLELSNRNFKTTTIQMLKYVGKKQDKMHAQMAKLKDENYKNELNVNIRNEKYTKFEKLFRWDYQQTRCSRRKKNL